MGQLLQLKQMESSVGKDIRILVESLAINSKNTQVNYQNDIEHFFMYMRNKKIEHLTMEDLVFKNIEVQEYQNRLATDLNSGKPYASSTINRKMSVLRSLYSKLEANDYNVKSAWFDVVVVKGESKTWSVVNFDTVLDMIALVKDTRKGDTKALLLETAVVTSFRKSELLALTWKDLQEIDGTWVLTTIGKGSKKNMKPITQKLYERLIGLKRVDCDKIFDISDKSVKAMMVDVREKLGLDENVTFHSLKKCGINEVYFITDGDIMAVAQQGNHSSFGTTMKHYMDMKQDFKNSPNLQIGSVEDIMKEIESFSKEELLQAIRSSSRSTKADLLKNLKQSAETMV